MELPKIGTGNMLSGIKSKLGFSGNAPRDDYSYGDGYAEDEFQDDYAADYGEYGYSGDGYDDYAGEDGYADYVETSAHQRSSRRRSGATSSVRDGVSPKLVSIDDVRAHTQIPDRLNRDPLPQRHVTPSTDVAGGVVTSRNRVLIDNTAPSPGSPESMRADRSAGLNSLFEPTDTGAARPAALAIEQPSFLSDLEAAASASAAAPATASHAEAGSFDPYDAYAGSGAVAHAPQRSCTVIKPVAYGDVERVAKTVRAGDVAILSLKATPDDLAKRVLDFSFGVASYADARVDCIADKVFAIVRGDAITEAEFLSLRGQGVV